LAASVGGGVDETTFYPQPVDPSLLVTGNNVLAVEISPGQRDQQRHHV
jgi:hypothetical protein